MMQGILGRIGLVGIALLAFWMLQEPGHAGHTDPNANYDPSLEIGAPRDRVSDDTADHPGSDRNLDRVPDRDGTPDGVPSPGPDRVHDSAPDCGNGPGDGACGNGTAAGDLTPDNFGPGDNDLDSSPDKPSAYDGARDRVRDNEPTFLNQDNTPDRQGGVKDCLPADVALGECSRGNQIRDFFSDRVGRDAAEGDGTPSRNADLTTDNAPDRSSDAGLSGADNPRMPVRDGIADLTPDSEFRVIDSTPDSRPELIEPANADGTPDGDSSRGVRDRGVFNHASPSRDANSEGPGDRSKDRKADEGGLGFGPTTIPTTTTTTSTTTTTLFGPPVTVDVTLPQPPRRPPITLPPAAGRKGPPTTTTTLP